MCVTVWADVANADNMSASPATSSPMQHTETYGTHDVYTEI